MTSRRTSPGCKASGPPSPKRGIPSDDRPSARPDNPLRGARRAVRLHLDADRRSAAGLRLLLPPLHVRHVDGRRHLFLVALGTALGLGQGPPAARTCRRSAGVHPGALLQRSRQWRRNVVGRAEPELSAHRSHRHQ
ncbi:hypothetical protein G6F57_019736 [Rhizopus arrhizus]|nr:hypothetical protein G6F57_019736 [Rhizopus arrhizus]